MTSTPLTFARSWQFNVGNLCRYPMSSALVQNQQSVLAVKNVIIGGAGQFGWTNQTGGGIAAPTFWSVYNSCDSAVAGAPGDLVDRWDTYTDIVWNASGAAHSWMVLKSTSALASSTLYWLIAAESGTSDSNTLYMAVSKLGFSLAAGGTNGSTTLKPTALDEQVMRNSAQWGAAGGLPIRFHVLMSSDGRATRVFTTYQTNLLGAWLLETMLDATTNVDSDLFASVYSNAGANPVNVASVSQTAQPIARTVGGAMVSGILSGEGSKYATNVQAGLLAVDRVMWNDMAAANQLSAVGAWGAIATGAPVARGHIGSLVDLWWGSDVVPCGQSFPDNYTRQLVTMGPLVIPWNTTLPKVF